MEKGRIVVVTGSPGTGKTTVAALAAAQSEMPRSVHLHTDDFYHGLVKGALAPHLPGADRQNLAVIRAFLASAESFAQCGYDVMVDGIVGPWFLEPFLAAAREGFAVHYFVLRADRAETLKRATSRTKLSRKENMELVEAMWGQFADLGIYERFVIDTTNQTAPETAETLLKKLAERGNLLP